MKGPDRITLDPEVMGGKPCIRGLRVTVGTILGLLAARESHERILAAYPYLEPEDIDEATLRDVAAQTGGRFYRARDTNELAGIYAELDRLEPVEQPGKAVRPRVERYAWPLAAAWAVALLAFLLPRRRA